MCLGRQSNHQGTVLDQRNGSVLQLPGGVGLRVNVGDFLQFQRPLQRDGIVDSASDKENVIRSQVTVCKALNQLPVLQNLLHLFRQLQESIDVLRVFFGGDGLSDFCKAESQEIEGGQLGAVGLGGGYRDFRACPGVHDIVSLSGNGASHHIDDSQDPLPVFMGLPESGQRVGSFAGLADNDDKGALLEDGVAVAELGSQIYLYRDAGNTLKHVFRCDACVIGGAAGHDHNFPDAGDLFVRHAKLLYDYPAVSDAGSQGVADCFWLLIDLLQHEMLIAAFFSCVNIPLDGHRLLGELLLVHVKKPDSLPGENGDLLVFHIVDASGILEDGRHIGGDEISLFTASYNQRAVFSGGKYLLREISEQNAQGIGAFYLLHDFCQGGQRVSCTLPFIIIVEKVGQHLCIRLRQELIAAADESLFQFGIIFDNSIVHHHNGAIPVEMGMGIYIGGASVCGPARVADA